MEMIFTLLIAAGLGLIPANIAKNKGYSFGLWWFYGWMLFIIALIHACCLPDKNQQYFQAGYGQPNGQPQYGQPQYGQPQYGQPQYGQPQYGQPNGQPQYYQPGNNGQPPYNQNY